MTPELAAIIVAALAFLGSVASAVQSRIANAKAAALDQRKVDKDAAVEQRRLDVEEDKAHWARTDEIIERLHEEVSRLDQLLRDARRQLEEEALTSAQLRGRVSECEMRIIRLKAIVQMLTDELRSHGIDVPGTET